MKLRRMWTWAAIGMVGSPLLATAADYPGLVKSDVPVKEAVEQLLPPRQLSSVAGVIDHGEAWGHASPWVEDVDGDGVKDLIVGDFSGTFSLYRNTGSNPAPQYAEPVKLEAGGVTAEVPIY